MQETLNRIEERYLKNSHEYDRDVDFATHNFLSVARTSDETLDDDEIRDVQDVLAQAVEAALMSYEAYALKEQDDSQEDNESEEVNETARYEEKAKELYKYANNHDVFGDKKKRPLCLRRRNGDRDLPSARRCRLFYEKVRKLERPLRRLRCYLQKLEVNPKRRSWKRLPRFCPASVRKGRRGATASESSVVKLERAPVLLGYGDNVHAAAGAKNSEIELSRQVREREKRKFHRGSTPRREFKRPRGGIGRRWGFKIPCPKRRSGSSPDAATSRNKTASGSPCPKPTGR